MVLCAGVEVCREERMKRNRLVVAMLLVSTWLTAAEPTFHGNNARTGVYESAGPKTLAGVKWTFKTGAPIVASPVIADGTVYPGSIDGYLYALDQEIGREKWKFKSRMPIASTAAIAGGTLYFVSSTGALAALDVGTGKPKWV